MRLIPKAFNEVILNFLQGFAFLTEVFYDCSNLNFVHFLSLTYPSPVCSKFLLKSVALKLYSFCQRCWIKLNYQLIGAGLGGSVGCTVRLETRKSRFHPQPRSATFFCGDWSWNIFCGHSLPSLIQEGQLSVSGERMCTILVNRLED